MLEFEFVIVENFIGFGIVNVCVKFGMLDKVYIILDEMNFWGVLVGFGVYLLILRVYIKE